MVYSSCSHRGGSRTISGPSSVALVGDVRRRSCTSLSQRQIQYLYYLDYLYDLYDLHDLQYLYDLHDLYYRYDLCDLYDLFDLCDIDDTGYIDGLDDLHDLEDQDDINGTDGIDDIYDQGCTFERFNLSPMESAREKKQKQKIRQYNKVWKIGERRMGGSSLRPRLMQNPQKEWRVCPKPVTSVEKKCSKSTCHRTGGRKHTQLKCKKKGNALWMVPAPGLARDNRQRKRKNRQITANRRSLTLNTYEEDCERSTTAKKVETPP